jgi:DNA polymerase
VDAAGFVVEPPASPGAVVLPPLSLQALESGKRADLLAELAALAKAAPEPPALGTLRETFVFATGNPEASLMLIGEAPGMDEERLGEPFVGKAGELLDKVLTAMGLKRRDVYISNIVKYRPKATEGDQGSGNRKPTAREMEVCLPIVRREISIIRPKVIVALGGTAIGGLIGDADARITQLRGKFLRCQGVPVMPTFHPSYLLRQEKTTNERPEKRKHWEDMMQVMAALGIPISEKQRGFFL